MTLSCDEDDPSANWTLWRNTSRSPRSRCGRDFGTTDGSNCDIGFVVRYNSGSYWCESTEGETSNVITISVTGEMRRGGSEGVGLCGGGSPTVCAPTLSSVCLPVQVEV